MKRIHRIILFLTLLPFVLHADKRVTTIIIPQSAAKDTARELAGWQNFINTQEDEGTHGVFAINPSYALSLRPERIVQSRYDSAYLSLIPGKQSEQRSIHTPCHIRRLFH